MVVTYTNAAAYEMKERILAAINEKLKEDPYNEHLRKQETYIHNARITTIHSFCLSIIKDNFKIMKKKALKTCVKHCNNSHQKWRHHDQSNLLCSVHISGYVLELEL